MNPLNLFSKIPCDKLGEAIYAASWAAKDAL